MSAIDDEQFCPMCLAGTESSEHFEKCTRLLRDDEINKGMLRAYCAGFNHGRGIGNRDWAEALRKWKEIDGGVAS